jgi:hypothetical protein
MRTKLLFAARFMITGMMMMMMMVNNERSEEAAMAHGYSNTSL